jgi:anti-sigma B factor antagonist
MHRTLSIEESRLGDMVLLDVVGEVDVASVREFMEAVQRAGEGDPRELWIDLTHVEFLDSTGLAVIVLAHRRLDRPVRRLSLICPKGAVRRVLEIAGVDRVVPVHASRDDAVALT